MSKDTQEQDCNVQEEKLSYPVQETEQANRLQSFYDLTTLPCSTNHNGGALHDFEHFKRQRALLRSPTPPWDDWPVPDIDDMTISPRFMTYTRKRSRRETEQTPAEYEIERSTWIKRRNRRRDKEDLEMYQGLQDFRGRQRGWDGRPESERRASEEENRLHNADKPTPKPQNLAPYPRRATAKEVEGGFESLQSQYTMDQLAAEDHVSILQERNHVDMMKAKWDPDAIKESIMGRQRTTEVAQIGKAKHRRLDPELNTAMITTNEKSSASLRTPGAAVNIDVSDQQGVSPSKKRTRSQFHSDEKQEMKQFVQTHDLSERDMRNLRQFILSQSSHESIQDGKLEDEH